MSEHAYCYTCNRAQLVEVLPHRAGWRICSVCKNDELGETVDPALTGGRSPGLGHDAPIRYVPAVESARSEPASFADIAAIIAATVEEKQVAYGDSFGKSGEVLAILYPHGIPVEAYGDALAIVRVVDKLFRIATDRDALGESPWRDIAGYALLAVRRVEQDKGRA